MTSSPPNKLDENIEQARLMMVLAPESDPLRGTMLQNRTRIGARCLSDARGRVAGKLYKRRASVMPQVRPYVGSEPDRPVVAVAQDFVQGPSWYLDPIPQS